MKLEEQQEEILRCNWELRKIFAKKIASYNGYDIMDCTMTTGQEVFYAVRNKTPVAYVAGHKIDHRIFQISSTYVTPVARRQGLAFAVYETIMSKVDTLISDFERSDAAEALWQKLMKHYPHFIKDNGASRYVATMKK